MCDSFLECVGDNPLPNNDLSTRFQSLTEILYFSLNLFFWLIYLSLFILLLVSLLSGIYKLAFEPKDSAITYAGMSDAFKKVAIYSLGLIILTGVNFFIVAFLQLIGAEQEILNLFGPAGLIL